MTALERLVRQRMPGLPRQLKLTVKRLPNQDAISVKVVGFRLCEHLVFTAQEALAAGVEP